MSEHQAGTITVEGEQLEITNPDKLLWPEMGITKAIYLQKLILLSPYLLKYCEGRYLTTIRFPDGVGGKWFYQKNAPRPTPGFVKVVSHDGVAYIDLNSLPTLLWLANLGCLEFHPSFEYTGGEQPAEWVLDIDPSEEARPRLMEAVALIGEVLDGMGIASVPKTSGATGVQIIVPIRTGYTFPELRAIGKLVGHYLAEKYPALFTVARRLHDRKGRIYLDYVQHAAGKSLSAPYTPRGRPGATVSTPLTWEEVRNGADPRSYHLLNIEERLAAKGDLLEKVAPQSLDDVLRAALRLP